MERECASISLRRKLNISIVYYERRIPLRITRYYQRMNRICNENCRAFRLRREAIKWQSIPAPRPQMNFTRVCFKYSLETEPSLFDLVNYSRTKLAFHSYYPSSGAPLTFEVESRSVATASPRVSLNVANWSIDQSSSINCRWAERESNITLIG